MSEALIQDHRRAVGAIRSAVGAFALALLTVPTGAQTRSINNGHTVIYSQPSTNARAATVSHQIRPFRVNVPDDALVDLRKRVLATRWPEKETVSDRSQGVQLAKLQELVRYWGTDYDWRKVEATLKAFFCRPRSLSQRDLLQGSRQGRPLRRVGAARAPGGRTPRRLQIA